MSKELEKVAKENNIEIFKISAATNDGLKELFNYVSKIIKDLPKEELFDVDERIVYTLEDAEKDFEIRLEGKEFIVEGKAAENLMRRVNIGDNESFAYLQKMIRKLGIEQELKRMGIQEGDSVKILEWEFEWYE